MTLTQRQLKNCYRLVVEVCQLSDNPEAWPECLAQGLRRIFQAKVVGISWATLPDSPNAYNQAEVQRHWGFTPEEERIWNEAYCGADRTFRSEFLRRMVSIPGRFITVRRQDVMPDSQWYALAEVQTTHFQCGIDANVSSFMINVPMRRLFGIGVHRAWGAPQFTISERKQLRLIQLELVRAWKNRFAISTEADAAIRKLPERLSQVLWLLCAGKSEQAIALQLQLSIHTVHNHVRRLHQLLGVSTRAELIARAMSRNNPLVYPIVPNKNRSNFHPS